jgi:hypothetical protein
VPVTEAAFTTATIFRNPATGFDPHQGLRVPPLAPFRTPPSKAIEVWPGSKFCLGIVRGAWKNLLPFSSDGVGPLAPVKLVLR